MSKEVRALIFRIVAENPTWRAPRIHGELLRLGLHLSEKSVRWHVRPCLPHLLHDPESVRISCHVETQNLSPVVAYGCVHTTNLSIAISTMSHPDNTHPRAVTHQP